MRARAYRAFGFEAVKFTRANGLERKASLPSVWGNRQRRGSAARTERSFSLTLCMFQTVVGTPKTRLSRDRTADFEELRRKSIGQSLAYVETYTAAGLCKNFMSM